MEGSAVEIKVIIPTKGRAATMVTNRYVSNCLICVAESEVDEYKKYNPKAEYAPHPDSIVGMAAKRQWIYDNYKNVFMMDDDLKGFSRMTQKKGETSHVSADLAYDIIQNCGNVARLCGAYMFGFNSNVRPGFYSGHEPYEVSGVINGCGMGMLEGADKLVFNSRFTLGHEFYISGLNAFHYRKAFFDMRYCINHASFGDDIGGCANLRTLETEKKDLDLLIYFFGSAIRVKPEHKKGKHQFSKNLIIPY